MRKLAGWFVVMGAWALGVAAAVAQPVVVSPGVGLGSAVPEGVAQVTAPSVQAEAWRAVSRFGYGPWPGVPDMADGAGGRAWVLAQLPLAADLAKRPAQVPPQWQGFEAPLPGLFVQFRAEREARQRGDDPATLHFARDMARHAARWRLHACSRPDVEHPLLARLTEFWFNHLNVSGVKGAVRPWVGHYVVHAIRPHVLGRYEDLLLASARHPAMLYYLDQVHSVAEGAASRPSPNGAVGRVRGLNENYARELMELHTLGVHGGYSQADVRALARMLTGWTVDPQSPSGFRFVARLHDAGPKVWLGQTIEPDGEQEGLRAIRHLARHPATAQRIALRLAQWFVADQPPPELVQRLASRYTETQGDLLAVVRTLVESDDTWDPSHRLFKTPMDFACSALAVAGGPDDERTANQVLGFLSAAGQPVHGWQTPDGYTTLATQWLSPEALAQRVDLALAVGRGMADVSPLLPWLQAPTRERLVREPLAAQPGLALASPDFMVK